MSSICMTHENPAAAPVLGTRRLLLLAAGAGFSVAALYYGQPLLGLVAQDLHASAQAIGLVPALTQLGYALGIALLAPLGDRFDRRRLIVAKSGLLALALLASAWAPSMAALLVASLLVGLTATVAQDIVPATATLAPDASRGKAVGTVMTGLLLGVLLSRVVSGVAGEHFGWRSVYVAAAGSVLLMGAALATGLPRFAPGTTLGYRALLASMGGLWTRHPALRRAAVAQGLLALGFSAFWSTLAVVLHAAPFHLGSAAAGAFGLAGAAGALAAPLAGRWADRHGPARVARRGTLIATAGFAMLALGPLLSVPLWLGLMVVAAVVFDFGMQATLVSHQTLVYGLDAGARSRLNAILFVGMFIGMALGAALGSLAFAHGGWFGLVALSSAAAAAAWAVRQRAMRA